MNHKKPVLATIITFAIAGLIVFGVYLIEKAYVKENNLVKANQQVQNILENETDFDSIIAYVEDDVERSRFLGITLTELAKNEEHYVFNFEARYPRYKAYRDMVKELARTDYSEWVAAVISGETETEFEANVFEYLSELEDDRYLDQAVARFDKSLQAVGSKGFAFSSNKDAFITGALGVYIAQFPVSKTQIAKTIIGQRISSFIDLSNELTNEINGMPLNKFFVYLYIKYFGLQDFIEKRMDAFMAKAEKKTSGWEWDMGYVNGLINDLTSMGKGISQNYYSLFRTGINKRDPVYIYIASQVLVNIGFDDDALHNLLNLDYRWAENTLYKTTRSSSFRLLDSSEEIYRRVPIVIADEIQKVRNAIKGKSDIPFEETFKSAVAASASKGKFIIPRVRPDEEIQKEMRNNSELYTHDFVNKAIVTWELKCQLLFVVAIIILLVAFICSMVAFARPCWRDDEPDNLFAWVSLLIMNLVLFFGFWNKYDNLSGFQIAPLIAFLIFGGALLIITLKSKLSDVPSRALWQLLLKSCGSFNYRIKRYPVSQFYYEAANIPIATRVNTYISNGDVERTIELLKNTADYSLSMRIINENTDFFSAVEPAKIEKLFENRLSWIDWLTKINRQDLLEKIRISTNEIINNGIPSDLIQDNNRYSDFVVGFAAFDNSDPSNHQAIENIVSNTMVQRYNNGNRAIPDMVTKLIDKIDISLNPSVLLALVQEESGNNRYWLWNRMVKDSIKTESPDDWFVSLLAPLDAQKLQKQMDISNILKLIDTGFSRCTQCIPALILLIQAREYVEKHNTYSSVQEYNRVLEKHKEKIEKTQSGAQEGQQ